MYRVAQNIGRDELSRELAAQERKENDVTRRACLNELMAPEPDNIYYSLHTIKDVLRAFYYADQSGDGKISLDEFFDSQRPGRYASEEEQKGFYENTDKIRRELYDRFKGLDVTGDNRLSLAEFFILGFLGVDRSEEYKKAKKID
ncbi:hypothetical protein BDV26DRAFT_295898 [Aspergillus bertholletiae]|uniref:EF-hand domain-containing protein n=1 Tax=Aspergillus bertholletiae TaxID=1226010 RepID=A0A5N7AYW2_9EURO|nr:hypothetical protein BDV26DRAFT_295898 [Aspergillus bertholletiae]